MSPTLRALRLVRLAAKLEQHIEATEEQTIVDSYVKSKLSKYLRMCYARLRRAYDSRHFKMDQLARDEAILSRRIECRGQGRCSTAAARKKARWMRTDLEKHYRKKAADFLNKYSLDVHASVLGIKEKFEGTKEKAGKKANEYERLLCAIEIYRYLKKYIEIVELRKDNGPEEETERKKKSANMRSRAKKHASHNTAHKNGSDRSHLIYCRACKREIHRKMLPFHLKGGDHMKKSTRIGQEDAIFDFTAKFKNASIQKMTKKFNKRIAEIIHRINGKAEPQRQAHCKIRLHCHICKQVFGCRKGYISHFERGGHREELLRRGAENIAFYKGIYTIEGFHRMQAIEKTMREENSFEEFENE